MSSGWTGGQISLLRAALGLILAGELVALIARTGLTGLLLDPGRLESTPTAGAFPSEPLGLLPDAALGPLLGLGVALAVLFAAGVAQRLSAALLLVLVTLVVAHWPLLGGPGPLAAAVLLALFCALPPRPYGSWAARGRIDPGGGWEMPPRLWATAWVVVGVGHLVRGLQLVPRLGGASLRDLVDGPLGRPGPWHPWLLELPAEAWSAAAFGAAAVRLAFLPLAAVRRARPWIWAAAVAFLAVEAAALDVGILDLFPLLLLLFLFDPAWIRPRPAPAPTVAVDRIFYDGHCGLCHRTVRFLLAEDPAGDRFRFAPLQGVAFAEVLPEEERSALPDSVVVIPPDGRVLVRSDGALRALRRLGGFWRLAAGMGALVPRPLRDLGYDGVARVRKRIFGAPPASCPLLPPELRKRFDLRT